MGYTHYWYRPAEIERDTFNSIVFDFQRILPALDAAGVLLGDGFGEHHPEITAERVWFNGLKHCGHPANHSLPIPWPSEKAGGLMHGDGPDGDWGWGVTIDTRICDGDCSYETFEFSRVIPVSEDRTTYGGGLYFDFCKTAFRPYDLAVTAFLVIAKRHMGDRLIVTSDGEPQHWFDAKLLCHLELGYGMDFAPESRPQEDPPPAPPLTEPRPYVPVTEAAKQIRRALKAAFPGVKFSVRSDSFSGGTSISIRWTDGPPVSKVKAIAREHEDIRLDQWGEILSGGNRYISCTRKPSLELEAKALARMLEECGDMSDMDSWSREKLLYRTIEEIDCTPTPPPPKVSTKKHTNTERKRSAPVTAHATYWISGAWSWLQFASKPNVDVLAALKDGGWRWSRKRSAWYHTNGHPPPAGIDYVERTA